MAASVEYITYNEKRYPIKLGIYSLMVLQNRDGISLDQINSHPEYYEPVLYMALKQGAQITKQELDIPKEDMNLVLEECFIEFTTLFPKFFPEEMLGKLMEDGGMTAMKTVSSPPKKKPVKKKSTTGNSRAAQ